MKKRSDPLWATVGEDVRLQGSEMQWRITCPECHVTVEVPSEAGVGSRVTCGLCGATIEVKSAGLVSD